jgi:hypothetical protein
MQIRIFLAAGLLACSAFALDSQGGLKPIPQPFAAKPRQFAFPKRIQPVEAPKGQSASDPSKTCSIPLKNFTPPTPAPRMPVLRGSTDPKTRFAMKFLAPPAPACEDKRAGSPQAPEN